MKDKVFFDSNLLVYYAADENKKKVITSLMLDSHQIYISQQCLNEFTNVCIKKDIIDIKSIRAAIEQFLSFFDFYISDEKTIFDALKIRERFQYSFYDSLIIASALASNCEIIYTEDLRDGQIIDGLKIVNPFKNQAE